MWSEKARRLGVIKSREASALRLKNRIIEYNKNPNKCKNCDKILSYEKKKNKFCCLPCSISSSNKKRHNKSKHGRYIKKECLYCKNLTHNIKYCCKDCCAKDKRAKRKKEIIENSALVDYKHDKWFLIETRGHQCEICGFQEWQKQTIPLDVDHKDGNSDNDSLGNIRLICPNCHRQTKNYGSKNRTGRYSRRKQYRNERYQEGLSY